MTKDGFDEFRASDPAARLGRMPDPRAEQDLQALLEQQPRPDREASSSSVVMAPGPRRASTTAIVTAVVAACVLVITAIAIGLPHVRQSTAGLGGSSAATQTSAAQPSSAAALCRPRAVFPLQCGTYGSTYGGAEITGTTGGPVKDPLQISFATSGSQMLLLARANCWTATVPVRFVKNPDTRLAYPEPLLQRAGAPHLTTSGCDSSTDVQQQWAYAFLHTDLRSSDAESFGSGDRTVFFQYLGAAPIGAPQLPRNETRCVAAHVQPFGCATYTSTRGTGRLAFLAGRPYRLTLRHINGQLTAEFYGRCNGLSVALQADGEDVVATGGGSTAMLCGGTRGTDDGAITDFFRGTIVLEQHDGTVTFTRAGSSATFAK